jgi:hypothetical protein
LNFIIDKFSIMKITLLIILVASSILFVACKKTPTVPPLAYHPDTFRLRLLDYNTKLPIPNAPIQIYGLRHDTSCSCTDTFRHGIFTDSLGYFQFLSQRDSFYYQWLIPQKDGYWCPMVYDPSPPQDFITGFHAVDTLGYEYLLISNFMNDTTFIQPVISDQLSTCYYYYDLMPWPNPNNRDTAISFFVGIGDTAEITVPY